jgi:Zn-dependent protease
VFWGLLGVLALAGLAAYLNLPVPQIPGFLFVLAGWVVLVCCHEFGHAAVAYTGGDTTVVEKGYLTLNPLKYTHRLLSIILPIVFLILGGIPLPGGAVYVDRSLIPRRMHSLLSAAGIIAQGILLALMLIPYHVANLVAPTAVLAHQNFWGVYSLLMYLDVFAMIINLLPIPGIDGYGIVEPYLPYRITAWVDRIRPYTFLILFLILWFPNPIRALIGLITRGLAGLLGIDLQLVGLGFSLFRFWGGL